MEQNKENEHMEMNYSHAIAHIEAKKKGLIGIIWDTGGKFLHHCGLRYSQAADKDMENVVNWTDRETLKRDAERYQDRYGNDTTEI